MNKRAISTLITFGAGFTLAIYVMVQAPMQTQIQTNYIQADILNSGIVEESATPMAEPVTSEPIMTIAFADEIGDEVIVREYSDVTEDYSYFEAIDYITQNGIVEGYDDGTYRPDSSINRAEFTKILVEAKLGLKPVSYADHCFADVDVTDWYSPYVCYAKMNEIIEGYPEGIFAPEQNINVVEASKIIVNVFGLEQIAQPVGTDWYSVYIETMQQNNYLAPSFEYVSDKITRGEMAEMVWRVMEQKHDLQALLTIGDSPCQPLGEDVPANVDMDRVRATWLKWYNDARADLDLYPYVYNDQLARTAIVWSEISETRGYIDHKRPGYTSYYDYYGILAWFEDLGITFEAQGGYTYVENIAWNRYACPVTQDDCTDEMIDAILYSYNFFMGEKGTDYTAHYDSVVNPKFKEIGLGIAVDEDNKKVYLTVHYATKINSDPMRICD